MTDDAHARLAKAARTLQKARAALDTAMESAAAATRQAIDDGLTEVDIAKALGVNRMTVRKWLGKL